MNSFPQSQPVARTTRVYLTERTPAVLRLDDGSRVPGKLKVVSLTGGLLSVTRPVETGSSAKVMFLTGAGMVLGAAKMLSPLSWELQPFRFVSLTCGDHERLKTTIRQSMDRSRTLHVQIERSRAW
jgi:hypothetical protein